MPVNTPHPGTSPPTPRGLIKSFFLTNYVVSLRGILRNQISPSHNEEEVFCHEASWLLLQVPPGGYLWGLECAQSCLSLQLPCTQLRPPPGTSFWKQVDLCRYFGKSRKLLKIFKKTKWSFSNCMLMNIHFKNRPCVIHSEVSQKEKNKYPIWTHIYGLYNGNDEPVCREGMETQT